MERMGWSVLRYILAIIAVLFSATFYFIFKPLTIWLSYGILSLFFTKVMVAGNLIFVNQVSVEIIPACVGGSAYLLLVLLNLLTPNLKFIKRIWIFLLASTMFLVLNLIRLNISIAFLEAGNNLFFKTHIVFWYVSIAFVVLIWFLCIKIFKIKDVPVYSDIKRILKSVKKHR
ncbi:MAG: pacearchaeosortase [archaeon]|nr:MAG: pacearchaeosortase [archaeon]